MNAIVEQDPASPCVGVCAIDPQTELCSGCFRTMAEIESWWYYAPADKHDVLARIDERCERLMDGTFFD